MSRSIEEELAYRQAALAGLENDDEALDAIQKRRHINRTARLAAENGEVGITRHGDETTFGAGGDELDNAAFLLDKMKHADGLQAKVALRQQKWQGLADVAKFTRINPASALQGILGNQTKVLQGGPAIEVANWGAASDAETLPVSVLLTPVPTPDPLFNGPRPFAIIKYGTHGIVTVAEVDIGKGCQFTVPASTVIVQVGMDPNSAGLNGSLAGMLSFYTIERTTNITRTRYVDVWSGAATTILVPNLAKSVSVWRTAPHTVSMSIDFVTIDGITVYTVLLPIDTYLFDPIPLSDDVDHIVITQTGGAAGQDVRAIFNLSL